ncbi:MAG: hypothetical protein KDD47_12985, partial [Acidobacteria bacterium]|nr:hypothetical protein [Acidobacteriota bacterium]
DARWEDQGEEALDQIRRRLTFSSAEGLLWFINVTLGFYLPQIKARDWGEAAVSNEPVRSQISGNGWDLRHAPINAVRIADAKREVFACGMLFLDPRGYRRALRAVTYGGEVRDLPGDIAETNRRRQETQRELAKVRNSRPPTDEGKEEKKGKLEELRLEKDSLDKRITDLKARLEEANVEFTPEEKKKQQAWAGEASWRGHLMLRIWTCSGNSRGRFWAAFSLWRGLGLIGEILELGLSMRNAVEVAAELTDPEKIGFKNRAEARTTLAREVGRLIRAHCINGLVPGGLLSQGTDENKLGHSFFRLEPQKERLGKAIEDLAGELVDWLRENWANVIYPLPAGEVWLGWGDCFIRRIHGDSILGALWPRLNSAYLEEQMRILSWQDLASRRSEKEPQVPPKSGPGAATPQSEERDSLWTAAVAAGAWTDVVLEYWRGCPPILKLLLSCPIFYKSQECFGNAGAGSAGAAKAAEVFKRLCEQKGEKLDLSGLQRRDRDRAGLLDRLKLPAMDWKEILGKDGWGEDGHGKFTVPALVGQELCIERVNPEQFASLPPQDIRLSAKKTTVEIHDVDKQAKRKVVETSSLPSSKSR